jgi:hypothetical protein
MATYVIKVIPDLFNSRLGQIQGDIKNSSQSSINTIRRPTRGIQLNEDTFATLRVVSGTDGKNIALVDAGSRSSQAGQPLSIGNKRANDIYSNFLLQSVQEERQEKAQILETFGEAYLFLFGERARVMNFSGILASTQDFNWEAEWWHNYENYLRGTRCIENNARVFLSYDNTLVSGYILNTSAVKSAQERNWVNFQFQLFVTSYTTLTDVGNPDVPKLGIGDSKFTNDTMDQDLNAQRPRLIEDLDFDRAIHFTAQGLAKPQNSIFNGGFLNASVAAQRLLDSVSQVSETLQKTANTAFRSANNLINGELVRIPVGLAGSTVFDSADAKVVYETTLDSGVVRFTTYSDNEDEYVGKSSHYGSALVGITSRIDAPLFNQVDLNAEYQNIQKQVNAARKRWENAGFAVAADSAITDLNSKLNPIKKLGMTVYTGVKTIKALVNVIDKSNDPALGSKFDSNFNPDDQIIRPSFKANPGSPRAKVGQSSGAGSLPHSLTPPKVE